MARIGRRSPSIDALLTQMDARQGGFVTAANPRSRRKPDAWNRRAQLRLAALTRRWTVRAGHGSGRGWREPHLLVAASPPVLCALARRCRQSGLVIVRRGAPARLVVLARA